MFASIPNYREFYDETDVNKQGLECLRLLNEIICDFDKVTAPGKDRIDERSRTLGMSCILYLCRGSETMDANGSITFPRELSEMEA